MDPYSDIPLPEACQYRFVGEGNANVVFEIVYPDDYDGIDIVKGRLLRVAKKGIAAAHHEYLQQFWEDKIKKILPPANLVQQSLFRLSGWTIHPRRFNLVPGLNKILSGMEESRRIDFRGSRVDDLTYGMLVEDMRKKDPTDAVLEFKPKWLAQSPNAPTNAKRCRNCAREAWRFHGKGKVAEENQILCSLAILFCSEGPLHDPAILKEVTDHLGKGLDPSGSQYRKLEDWLRTNTLMAKLRSLQVKNDPRGPMLTSGNDMAEFALAMTLRDCTLFIRIPADEDGEIVCKLGDLDKKNWVAKISYWKETEQTLIEKYYDKLEHPQQPTNCYLARLAD